jgi:hypothetical protein
MQTPYVAWFVHSEHETGRGSWLNYSKSVNLCTIHAPYDGNKEITGKHLAGKDIIRSTESNEDERKMAA